MRNRVTVTFVSAEAAGKLFRALLASQGDGESRAVLVSPTPSQPRYGEYEYLEGVNGVHQHA